MITAVTNVLSIFILKQALYYKTRYIFTLHSYVISVYMYLRILGFFFEIAWLYWILQFYIS